MKTVKVSLASCKVNAEHNLPYIDKDEAIRKYMTSTQPTNRTVSGPNPFSATPCPEVDFDLIVGYIMEIDYEREEATLFIYNDATETDGRELRFTLIGEVTDEGIIVDKIVNAYIK